MSFFQKDWYLRRYRQKATISKWFQKIVSFLGKKVILKKCNFLQNVAFFKMLLQRYPKKYIFSQCYLKTTSIFSKCWFLLRYQQKKNFRQKTIFQNMNKIKNYFRTKYVYLRRYRQKIIFSKRSQNNVLFL